MGTFQIKKGVNVTVLPTKKYKTVQLILRFQVPLRAGEKEKRTLLSSVLESSSKKYPNRMLISERASELYGANIGMNVTRKGQQSLFTVSLSVVNDKFLPEKKILKQGVELVKELLFFPNVQEGLFETQSFETEKTNLLQYMASVVEDKQYYANVKLNELFFGENEEQATPSFGDYSRMETITNEELMACYKEMLSTDEVEIIVVGDVLENEIREMLQSLPFVDRMPKGEEIFYTPIESNVIREKVEREDVEQSRLHLAYRMPVHFDDPEFFSLMVLNGILGTFAHSRLFLNIREKEGMAYSASSSFDSYRGVFYIQTGIDAKNKKKVLQLIHKELESIRKGEITDIEFQQTKTMLLNTYLTSLDSQKTMVEQAYIERKFPYLNRTKDHWIQALNHVTKEMVRDLAKELKLSTMFFLEGKEVENENQ